MVVSLLFEGVGSGTAGGMFAEIGLLSVRDVFSLLREPSWLAIS